MQRKGFMGLFLAAAAAPLVPFVPRISADKLQAEATTNAAGNPDFSHWIVEYREKGTIQWKPRLNSGGNIRWYHSDALLIPTETPGRNEYQSFAFGIDGKLLGKNGLIIQEMKIPVEIADFFTR